MPSSAPPAGSALRAATMFRADEVTRVVEGAGGVERLGSLAADLGARRVFLVSDPGVVAAGHAERGRRSLEAAGLAVELFDDVHENPSSEDVARGAAAATAFGPDLYVALGGGSSIDAAKGANFIENCGGTMRDYWGHAKATAPLRPMIAVPTTAGTGSEVQSFALVTDAETGRKMACGDPTAAPRIALLDAELTVTMPREVTAMTGLDTLAHAVESAVAKPRDAGTDGRTRDYARESFRLVLRAFPRVLESPDDVEARADMLRASALGGLAIEHAMLGAAHSMANPLTRVHGVAHGLAVGTMLPHVVRYNAEEASVRAIYADLARTAGLPGDTDEALAGALADCVAELHDATGLPSRLAAHGVEDAGVPALAAEAAEQWTAGFNPRAIDARAFESLLRGAL
ncbi:MAG: iron-containing alcohol dehydrogenase [Planctomycetota bacterium]